MSVRPGPLLGEKADEPTDPNRPAVRVSRVGHHEGVLAPTLNGPPGPLGKERAVGRPEIGAPGIRRRRRDAKRLAEAVPERDPGHERTCRFA